jgi:hypothetical protein
LVNHFVFFWDEQLDQHARHATVRAALILPVRFLMAWSIPAALKRAQLF